MQAPHDCATLRLQRRLAAAPSNNGRGWKVVLMITPRQRAFLSMAVLAACCSCGSGNSGPAASAFIVNKSSGTVVACDLTNGAIDFGSCRSASAVQFLEPIQMVISGNTAFISVQEGIERCTLRRNQLTSCALAICDAGFPVGLTLSKDALFVADYSAKSIVQYNVPNLQRVDSKSIPTAPTDVVFLQGAAFIVTQDIAGSVVLACNMNLEDCAPAYSPVDKALLAMTTYQGVAFFTDASGNNVVSCDVNDGTLSGCAVQGDATIFNYPYGITIHRGLAYIPNRAEASITVCDVRGKQLSGCNKVANVLFDGPTWVTLAHTSTSD